MIAGREREGRVRELEGKLRIQIIGEKGFVA